MGHAVSRSDCDPCGEAPWNDADDWHRLAGLLLAKRLLGVADRAFPGMDDARLRAVSIALKERWLVFGAISCTADLVDCVRTSELRGKLPPEHEFWGDFSDGEDGKGRYAFKLENVQILANPIPFRGMQGFFNVDLGELERVSELAQGSSFGGVA